MLEEHFSRKARGINAKGSNGMNVEFKIIANNGQFFSSHVRNRFIKLVHFFEDYLLKLYTNVEKEEFKKVNIILVDATHVQEEASCQRSTLKENEFYIRMVFNGSRDVVEKLAHELCHVMQYLSGKLMVVNTENNIVSWKGEEFILTQLPHNDRPWEKEAIRFGLKLYGDYLSTKS